MLSDKEKLQIREVVDMVVEARLQEFAEIQLTIISDMLMKMTERYVDALVKLTKALYPEATGAHREMDRMAELMLQELKKR